MIALDLHPALVGPSTLSASGRFWSKVNRNGECWEWTGALDKYGYGVLGFDRRTQFAHRVSYQLSRGPIGIGLTIDHLCRNKKCVRPGHLEAVTIRENVRRAYVPRTHCPHGHELTADNMMRHGRSNRVCRTCRRAYEKTKKSRRK